MAIAQPFFYDGQPDSPTLQNRLTLSDVQYQKIQEVKDQVQARLDQHLRDRSGRPVRFWIQGSYKNGTIIRPVRKDEEFDVDLGAYIEWPLHAAGYRPKQIKTWTRECLSAFADSRPGSTLETPPKPRCERINIDREFHLDVPTYHLDAALDFRRLATEEDNWEESDPKALQVWFLDSTERRNRDAIKRQIKYLKAWAALKWPETNERPNSTALTILAVQSCHDALPDDEAFAAMVQQIRTYFDDHTELPNPVDGTDLLQLVGHPFHIFHTRLVECDLLCQAALRQSTAQDAAISWDEVFEHLFPPVREHVAAVDNVRNLPVVQLRPVIRADVRSQSASQYTTTYTDDFTVPKHCGIDFSLANAAEIPFDVTVSWVVRNQGDEASRVNDLGHTARGIGKLTQHEVTKYAGAQYMDCILSRNGRFLGMSSIKVTITDTTRLTQSARPWYRRFR